MQISNRIENILGKGSDGWGAFYKARRMIRDGIDVTRRATSALRSWMPGMAA